MLPNESGRPSSPTSKAQRGCFTAWTYWRIVASLPLEVARRYGYIESATDRLEQQLQAAIAGKDWSLARKLATKLETAQATEAMRQSDAG